MRHRCRKCGAEVAREDRRRRPGERMVPVPGVVLELEEGQAPRIRCPCGHVTVFVKGSF